jgi:hypothetical protein
MIQLDDPWEHMVMKELVRCATAGELCPTVTHFAVLLDCSEGGTVVGIMKRLEARGLILVTRYQKTRQVTILATGAKTAEPKSKAIHWRDRIGAKGDYRRQRLVRNYQETMA